MDRALPRDHADIAGTLDGIGAEILDRRLDQLAKAIGLVIRTHGDTAGYGPADQTLDQRRARALVLLATPHLVARLLLLERSQHSGATSPAAATVGDDTAASSRDLAGMLNPITLYVHLRADGLLDLEGLGVLTLPTVADLLATTTGTVRVQPVIDLQRHRPHGRLPPV